MRIPVLAAALAVLAAPVQAAPALVVPTAKWVVDFDDAQCVASLAFGQEQLFLKASPLGDVVQFGIMEPGRTGPPKQVEAKITPVAGPSYTGTAMQWTSTLAGPRRMRLVNMPAADFRRLAASPSLAFQIGEMRRHYAMPAMAAMTKVMKSCVDDLQQVWSSEGGVAARAVASLASYFGSDDYPEDAIRKDLGGTTGLALLIDEEGRVADCMVVQTSGQAALDTQSCAVIKRRARFTPARGFDGQPTKDRVTSRINWLIP